MKKKLLLSLAAFSTVALSFAQNVAINADASLPNSSAMLDVKSTSKGMLIPRVALTSIFDNITVPNPVTSLMVYNTTAANFDRFAVVPGFYYWDGPSASWVRVVALKGGAINYQDFYSFPGENMSIPVNGAISFSQTAVANSTIQRSSSADFVLPEVGTYEVAFQLSVNEAAQVGISLNGFAVASSVVGRSSGGTQVVGLSFITTTISFTTLRIVNFGNSPITLSQFGGPNFVYPHLIIKKLN